MSVEFANRTLEGEFGRKANSQALKPIFGGPTSTWYVRMQSSRSSGPRCLTCFTFPVPHRLQFSPMMSVMGLMLLNSTFSNCYKSFSDSFQTRESLSTKLGIQQNLTQNATEQNGWRQNCSSWKGPTPPLMGLFSTHGPLGSGIWKPLTSADTHTEALLFFPSPKDLGQTPLETTVRPLPKGQNLRREHQQKPTNQN